MFSALLIVSVTSSVFLKVETSKVGEERPALAQCSDLALRKSSNELHVSNYVRRGTHAAEGGLLLRISEI
jgi:hypothetical protein